MLCRSLPARCLSTSSSCIEPHVNQYLSIYGHRQLQQLWVVFVFCFSFQTESYFIRKQWDITDICTTLDLMILDFMHLVSTSFSLFVYLDHLCPRQGYSFLTLTLRHPRRLKHCDPQIHLGFYSNTISCLLVHLILIWLKKCNLTAQLFYGNILIPRKQCNVSGMCILMGTLLLQLNSCFDSWKCLI